MTMVQRYGVHWAPGDIAYLLQDTLFQHVLPYELPCPYSIDRRRVRFTCPHNIQLSRADPQCLSEDWVSDPLVSALNPAPVQVGEPNFFGINDPHNEIFPVVRHLVQMSAPTTNLVTPAWYRNVTQLHYRMHATNVSPIVMTGLRMSDGKSILRMQQLARQTERRVLLVFEEQIAMNVGCRMISTDLREADLEGKDLLTVGATMLRNYMRPPE